MKVIVFGGSGFLGSHVADALTEKGHDVTVFDVARSPYLEKNQKMIVGDILDDKKVNAAVKGKDVVYNFAGLVDMYEAARDPLRTVKTNIIGNSVILDAAKKEKVKRFVFASSLYVYSKAGSFYRSSKQACELIIENYNEIYGLPYTILRYGSLYGPRADKKNFMYRVINEALKERKITRNGDGEELREYIHVYDAARLSVDILDNEYKNQHVIITGSQQIKVKDLLVMIKEMLDNKVKITYKPTRDPVHYEMTPYSFSPKLAKRLISKSYVDLGQGILKCIQMVHEELS